MDTTTLEEILEYVENQIEIGNNTESIKLLKWVCEFCIEKPKERV